MVPVSALYDFRRSALDAVETAFAAGVRRQPVAWPTGLGRTLLFTQTVARLGCAPVLARHDELISRLSRSSA